MSVPRGTGSISSSRRGQSTLMGMVLLIGMVAAGSVGIFLVAGEMLTDVEQQSEADRVEQAFAELSQQMAMTSSNGDVSRTMDIDVGDSGAVMMSDTGNLSIRGGDVNKTIPIGAIEYTGDDGTRIAYQAGGVFRETGNQTQVVSAPPIRYHADSETLSFPIIKTRGETQLNSGEVSATHHRTNPLQNASLVENDTVTIEVESEYYRGWEEYFSQQGGATTVQDVEVIDESRGRVTAEFGYIEGEAVFDSGITVSREPGEGGNVDVDETDFKVRHHSMQELDDVIDDMVEDKNSSEYWGGSDSPPTINGGEELTHEGSTDGTYFADGINLGNGDTTEVNVSDGNVTLIIDGSMSITHTNANFSVIGTDGNDNTFRIYLTEEIQIDGGTIGSHPAGEAIDAKRFQVYGTSETTFDMTDGVFEGFIYSPSNKYNEINGNGCEANQACFHSNPEFYGGLYASSVYYQGGKGSFVFKHDESLAEAEIDLYPAGYKLPPQITYLNVAEHQVTIEGN